MRILGLDEAGRGSVLGPLVVGAFCCDEQDSPRLHEAGARDSKVLTARRRQHLIAALEPMGSHQTVHISPNEIDAGNINGLEEDAFVTLIGAHKPDRVFLDAPVNPRAIPAFTARLQQRVGAHIELVVEPKADARYPVVGAASIFAKVERDAAIEALGPVGSGYPSDPKTRQWILAFLQDGQELPDCVRRRWGTIDALRQQVLFSP